MISLTPKKRFQESPFADPYRVMVKSPAFETAVTQALAEFTMTLSPSTEEMNGVRGFISVLLNMAEVETDLPRFPAKHISLSPDLRRQSKTASPQPTQRPD